MGTWCRGTIRDGSPDGVLERGRPLLEKDPVAVSEFREYVFRVYGDFEPFYRAFCQDHDRGLREAFPRDRPRQGSGQWSGSETEPSISMRTLTLATCTGYCGRT